LKFTLASIIFNYKTVSLIVFYVFSSTKSENRRAEEVLVRREVAGKGIEG
jgi:hypothetical protein